MIDDEQQQQQITTTPPNRKSATSSALVEQQQEYTVHEGWLYRQQYATNKTLTSLDGENVNTISSNNCWVRRWFQIKENKLIQKTQPSAPLSPDYIEWTCEIFDTMNIQLTASIEDVVVISDSTDVLFGFCLIDDRKMKYHFCTESEQQCKEWYMVLKVVIDCLKCKKQEGRLFFGRELFVVVEMDFSEEIDSFVQQVQSILSSKAQILQQKRATALASFFSAQQQLTAEQDDEKRLKRSLVHHQKCFNIQIQLLDKRSQAVAIAQSILKEEKTSEYNRLSTVSNWNNLDHDHRLSILEAILKCDHRYFSCLVTIQKLELQYEFLLQENVHMLMVNLMTLCRKWNEDVISLCSDRTDVQNNILFLDSMKPKGYDLVRSIKVVVLESVKYQTSIRNAQLEFAEEKLIELRKFIANRDKRLEALQFSALTNDPLVQKLPYPQWITEFWEVHVMQMKNTESKLYKSNAVVQNLRSKLEAAQAAHTKLSLQNVSMEDFSSEASLQPVPHTSEGVQEEGESEETKFNNRLQDLLHSPLSAYHQKMNQYTKHLIGQISTPNTLFNQSKNSSPSKTKSDLYNIQSFIKSIVDSLIQNELEEFFYSNPELDWKDLYAHVEKYLFEQQRLQVINSNLSSLRYPDSPLLSPYFFYNLFMSKVKSEAFQVDRTFQLHCIQVSHNLIIRLLQEQNTGEEDDNALLRDFYTDFGEAILMIKSLSVNSGLSQQYTELGYDENNVILSPTSKLLTITAAAKAVMQKIVERKQEEHKRKNALLPEGISTDDFLPIFICVVCASELPDMFSELNFIKSFSLEDLMVGESGFYFSSFESAAFFILNFNE
jgi:hypothetical protein